MYLAIGALWLLFWLLGGVWGAAWLNTLLPMAHWAWFPAQITALCIGAAVGLLGYMWLCTKEKRK